MSNTLNHITDWIVKVLIATFIIFVLINEAHRDYMLKKYTYNYLELKHLYSNYQIVEKSCINDTCYYLRLHNPIDSINTIQSVKVKDYIYFNWFVGDYIK